MKEAFLTLAVAIRFPFGHLAELPSAPHLSMPLQEAVIFATDSRVTARARVVADDAPKLFRVAGDAALVYSGDTLAGQAAVRDLRRYFNRRARGAPNEATAAVRQILRNVYVREQLESSGKRTDRTKRPPVPSLDILMGVCSPTSGSALMLYMSSRYDFAPLEPVGRIAAVGSGSDAESFFQKLHEMEDEEWSRIGGPYLDADHWQILVVAAMHSALEHAARTRVVGGRIQNELLKKEGFVVREFSYLGEGGNVLDASAWTVATIPPDQTRSVRRVPRSDRPYASQHLGTVL